MAFGNNHLYLTSAHTGKVVHQIDCTTRSASPICCLGWGINITGDYKIKHERRRVGPEASLDDLLSQGVKHESDTLPDLPRDLAFLDVDALLPRLSSLALGGLEYQAHAPRHSLYKLTSIVQG